MFKIIITDKRARVGEFATAHGIIQTPTYLPCATHGALRGVPWQMVKPIGLQALLVNAYHVALRPGVVRIAELGGLHKYIGWDRPILTDSGGFQAFALSSMSKYSEHGITFRSHLDGQKIILTPERVVEMQELLGVDLATCLDVCTGFPVPESVVAKAVDQTNRWAERSIATWQNRSMKLYGMVQGSIYPAQRRKSAEYLRDLPFAGFAVGGNMYTFGDTIKNIEREKTMMWDVLSQTTAYLPTDKPRHLLGVGEPSDVVDGVRAGIDTFDCVMATRLARHGSAWIRVEANDWQYRRINLVSAKYGSDQSILDSFCDCQLCSSSYSKAYLSHLLRIKDPTAGLLLSIHNIAFLTKLTESIRESLMAGNFSTKFPAGRTLRLG